MKKFYMILHLHYCMIIIDKNKKEIGNKEEIKKDFYYNKETENKERKI